jgi:hypothetical protein
MFAAVAAFVITRDAAIGYFLRSLPEYAHVATGLVGFGVSSIAYGLARLWLRRLP